MDETDLRLCQMLLLNARTPYRDLSDALGISVQAVHRRVQILEDEGCVFRWVTLPTEKVQPYLSVYVYGHTRSRDLDGTIRVLGGDDRAFGVYIASGNRLYFNGIIRGLGEMGAMTSFVSEAGEVDDPVVGIIPSMTSYGSYVRNEPAQVVDLSPLETRIAGALYADPRKPVAEIAKEVGASTRTVKRHLDRLLEENLILPSFEWYPKPMGDQIVFLHIHFNTDVDLNTVISDYMGRYSPRIVFFIPFVNIPRHLLAITWSRSMLEFEDLQKAIEGEPLVGHTEAQFMYRGGYFPTWRDAEFLEAVRVARA